MDITGATFVRSNEKEEKKEGKLWTLGATQ